MKQNNRYALAPLGLVLAAVVMIGSWLSGIAGAQAQEPQRCINFTQEVFVGSRDELNDQILGGVQFQTSAQTVSENTIFQWKELETGRVGSFAMPPQTTTTNMGVLLAPGVDVRTIQITSVDTAGAQLGEPAIAKVVRPGTPAATAGTETVPPCQPKAPSPCDAAYPVPECKDDQHVYLPWTAK